MAIVHLSPEMPRRSVQGYRREPSVPADFLSASLGEYQLRDRDREDGQDVDFPPASRLKRSFSGRPRSNSVSVAFAANGGSSNSNHGKLRKSWRGLGRRPARPSSGWGKANSVESRRVSPSEEEASMNEVDVAFTRIKEQLVSSRAS